MDRSGTGLVGMDRTHRSADALGSIDVLTWLINRCVAKLRQVREFTLNLRPQAFGVGIGGWHIASQH
jgi:hypothetical protein